MEPQHGPTSFGTLAFVCTFATASLPLGLLGAAKVVIAVRKPHQNRGTL